jgi:hypothetical protein
MNAPTTSSSSSSSYIEPRKRKFNKFNFEYESGGGYSSNNINMYEEEADDDDDDEYETSDFSVSSATKNEAEMIIPEFNIKKEYVECDGSRSSGRSHNLVNRSAHSYNHNMQGGNDANNRAELKTIEFTEWDREAWVELFDINYNLM